LLFSISPSSQAKGIATIFTGMGSLAYGELAGERIKLGLMLHDPEEESDCFSDNTHWSHYYDAKSIQNVYTGRYTRIDGSLIEGPSVSNLVAAKDQQLDQEINKRIDHMMVKMQVLVDSAEKDNIAYDQLLAEGNIQGGKKIMAVVDSLLETTKGIEKGIKILKLEAIAFEGSDNLDSPDAINQ
jgi:putative iron-regulated protein